MMYDRYFTIVNSLLSLRYQPCDYNKSIGTTLFEPILYGDACTRADARIHAGKCKLTDRLKCLNTVTTRSTLIQPLHIVPAVRSVIFSQIQAISLSFYRLSKN